MAKIITVEIPDAEQEILEEYCKLSKQTQTGLIRELIRTTVKKRLIKLKRGD
jgi:hypothetical protein